MHRAIIACEHTSNCKRPACAHMAAGSFVQANYGAFQSALASIRQHVPPGSRVVELHAGVGAIGLSLLGPMATEARGFKGEAREFSANAADSQRKEGLVSLRWGSDYTGAFREGPYRVTIRDGPYSSRHSPASIK